LNFHSDILAPPPRKVMGALAVLLVLGAQAVDECDFWGTIACGAGQTCIDSNTTGYGSDFVCRCQNGVEAVGGPAICEIDECATMLAGSKHTYRSTCGPNQTCSDPDKSANSRFDFICTCTDTGHQQKGTWARCTVDECLVPSGVSGPCGPDQLCNDGNLTPYSSSQSQFTLGFADYTCTCPGGGNASSRVGRPAICAPNGTECDTNPCDSDQTCTDPSPTVGDFICACNPPYMGSAKGQAAVCHVDDCWVGSVDKCGGGQYCQDTRTEQAKFNKFTHDFWCYCVSPMWKEGQGQPAPCFLDDCDWPGMACGTQDCIDKDYDSREYGIYHCYCPNQVDTINRPANCTIDEACPQAEIDKCLAVEEACQDNDTRGDALGVFRCAPFAITPAPEEDSSMPWYVILVIALAVICCAIFIAALVRKIRQKRRLDRLMKPSPLEKKASEMTAPYQKATDSPKKYAGQQFLSVPGQVSLPVAPQQRKTPLSPSEAGQVVAAAGGVVAGAAANQKAGARRGRNRSDIEGHRGITITCVATDDRPTDSISRPTGALRTLSDAPSQITPRADSPRRAGLRLGSPTTPGGSQPPSRSPRSAKQPLVTL